MGDDRSERLVQSLRARGVHATTDLSRRRACSRDFSWLSPVLAQEIPSDPADVVASVHTVEDLLATVSLATQSSTALTLRGRGTGNYAQSVPLRRGLVVDTSAMARVLEVDDGSIEVEPGASCQMVEAVARQSSQELAIFPSTLNSTIGGFVAGGAGGSGSIEHGWIWDGFVVSVSVIDALEQPTVHDITGSSLSPFLHAYGTTGVLASLRVRLVPATAWTGMMAGFARFEDALEVAASLLRAGYRFRLLGVTEPRLAATLDCPGLQEGRASVRAVVALEHAAEVAARVETAGGTVDGIDPLLVGSVVARSYNHVTLRAKRRDRELCHLQVGGPALEAAPDVVRSALPEASLHLDARRASGEVGFGGLLIGRYPGPAQLVEAVAGLRAAGVEVVNPHTWQVTDVDGSKAAVARQMDPAGLCNPGKLVR